MKLYKRYSRNAGFTLLELLAVMLIMFMLMGMGTVAMKGLLQGSGISGATSNVRSVLTQARQYAITKERRVYVIFDKSTGSDGDEKSSMTVCAKYGVCFQGDVSENPWRYVLTEDPLPWGSNTLYGSTVYNLRNKESAIIEKEEIKPTDSRAEQERKKREAHPDVDKFFTSNTKMGWRRGDAVGFEVAERRYLPSGMEFDDSTVESLANNPITFNPNGSAGNDYTVKFKEMYIANPVTVDLEVDELTGWVE